MTLKRKASFTTVISPRAASSYNASVVPVPFLTGDVIAIDENPRHLHSRTRKRFKNDRPEDQSVYGESTGEVFHNHSLLGLTVSTDKTMQFLYSAQKQMKYGDSGLSPTSTETDTYESAHTLPTAPDPMQQTLQKFFQPVRTSTHTLSNNVQNGVTFGTHDNSNFGSASSNMVAGSMDVDVEMSMDIDMPSDASSSSNDSDKRWVGGIGWM